MRRFQTADEGQLTALEARLTSSAALYECALLLSLQYYVVANVAQMRASQHYVPRVLEDCLEALIGAIYLDRGFKEAERFVLDILDKAAGLHTLGTEGWDHRCVRQTVDTDGTRWDVMDT